MTTNAGCKNVDLSGDVLGLGKAWFDPKFITNIFGFLHLIDLGYAITYDSTVEDAFVCKHPDYDPVKFHQLKMDSTSTSLPKTIFRLLPTKKIMMLRATNF